MDDGHAETAPPHDEPLRFRDSETKLGDCGHFPESAIQHDALCLWDLEILCLVLCMYSIRSKKCFTDVSL